MVSDFWIDYEGKGSKILVKKKEEELSSSRNRGIV